MLILLVHFSYFFHLHILETATFVFAHSEVKRGHYHVAAIVSASGIVAPQICHKRGFEIFLTKGLQLDATSLTHALLRLNLNGLALFSYKK
jgi:hypothetical protein